jgi:zinc protease
VIQNVCRQFLQRAAWLFAGALLVPAAALAAPGVPETRRLDNGLRIVLLEDHAVPLAAVSLWVGSGSKHEVEGSNGYAHFLEHLIQRGTVSTGPFEYTRRSNRWGGGLSVRSNYDRTAITVSGVAAAAPEMIDAVADLALHATLKDEEIDLELRALTQEIRTYYDLPSSVAFLETMRGSFPGHVYRWPPLGNFRQVGTLKSAPLQAFYKNLYVPNNMAIAVTGDVDPKAIQARIEAAFAAAPRSATLPARTTPPATLEGHSDIEKRLDVHENWTTISLVGPGYRHPDRLAFEALTAALADPATGIATNLRQSGTGTLSQVSYQGLEDAGMLYVAINPSSADLSYPAADAAMRAIAALKKNGLPPAAFRSLVARLLRDERARAAAIQERAERLGEALLFGGVRYYWDRPDQIRRLTSADLTRVMNKYLVTENLRLMILMPKASGDMARESKDAFHKSMDTIGSAGGNLGMGLEAELYSGDALNNLNASAWGDPKGASAARTVSRQTLKNGLSLVVVEDHRAPVAAAALQVRGGSGLDPEGRAGQAGLVLRLLAARMATAIKSSPPEGQTTSLLPEAQVLRDAIELRLGGDAADLPAGLAAIATALRAPFGPDEPIDAARQGALLALARADQDPDSIGLDLAREKVYAGHPYAHRPDGTTGGLKASTLEEVVALRGRMVRPEVAVLAIVGDVDGKAITKEIERLFGDWKPGGAGAAKPHGHDEAAAAATGPGEGLGPATTGALPGDYSRQGTAPQSRVLAGVPGPPAASPDLPAWRALGAAFTLLAFEDLVFERRAAFSAVSMPEPQRDGGALFTSLVTPPQSADEALFETQKLLRRLAIEPMSGPDLRDLGRMLAGREAATAQSPLELASTLAWRETTGIGAAGWSADLIPATPDGAKMQALAGARFRPEAWVTVVVGPR